MTSMMGGRRGHNVLEFLSASDKVKAVIRTHNDAVRKHAVAADNFKKKKDEALEVIRQLEQAQLDHNDRDQSLSKLSKELNELKDDLNTRDGDLEYKAQELDRYKEELDSRDLDLRHKLDQLDRLTSQRENHFNQKTMDFARLQRDLEEKAAELGRREGSVNQREQAILALADTLRR